MTTTQRTMPTLAAVPSQRTTQPTTKRPVKRPNEASATVRPHAQADQVLRITNQPSNVEYTIYTVHVNIYIIQSNESTLYAYRLRLSTFAMHSTFELFLRYF